MTHSAARSTISDQFDCMSPISDTIPRIVLTLTKYSSLVSLLVVAYFVLPVLCPALGWRLDIGLPQWISVAGAYCWRKYRLG